LRLVPRTATSGYPYRKGPTEGGNYAMDHMSSVIVADADGELVTLIDYNEEAASASTKHKRES